MQPKWARFSGNPANWNFIPGFPERGMASQKRHSMTPFGSSWNPLRKWLKSIGEDADTVLKDNKFRAMMLGSMEQAVRMKEGKVLGKGAYGEVKAYKASIEWKDREFILPFVSKTAIDTDIRSARLLSNEEALLNEAGNLEHLLGEKAIPDFYGFNKGKLFMEDLQGNSALNVLSDPKVNPTAVKESFKGLGKQLESLHSQGMAHRDLAYRNIMLSPKEGGGYNAALIDFGLSGLDVGPGQNRDMAVFGSALVRLSKMEQGLSFKDAGLPTAARPFAPKMGNNEVQVATAKNGRKRNMNMAQSNAIALSIGKNPNQSAKATKHQVGALDLAKLSDPFKL